jgi:hypothetical protein
VDEETRREVASEALFQMMDAVGGDAVVLQPSEDDEWAEQLSRESPSRFAKVPICESIEEDGYA